MSDNPQPTILAADDSAMFRKLIEHSLIDENCELLFANDGQQAINLFAEHKPAVLITDWTMPDISGVELCQRVRRDFGNIILTLFFSRVIRKSSRSFRDCQLEPTTI